MQQQQSEILIHLCSGTQSPVLPFPSTFPFIPFSLSHPLPPLPFLLLPEIWGRAPS